MSTIWAGPGGIWHDKSQGTVKTLVNVCTGAKSARSDTVASADRMG